MDASQLNRYVYMVTLPLGLLTVLYWRDLGTTLLVIGAVNYILHKKDTSWTVI